MNNSQYKTPKITFSSDGIRGISEEWPFTEDGMYCIGQALSSYLLKKKHADTQVVLGRDTRPSGKKYVRVLKNCFIENGIKVVDLGIAPTPVAAYLTKKKSAQLGVVVSASHNPVKYNGIKLLDSRGLRLQIEDEQFLEEIINFPENLPNKKNSQQLEIYDESYSENYIDEYITDQVEILYPSSLQDLIILIDCSNGAVARTGKKLLSKLGAHDVITINDDLSGQKIINENCGSEQARKHPSEFIKLVQENSADYGLAFDGDGDRVVVVDKKGNFYNGDDLLYVLAIHYAKKKMLPENVIITTEMANSGLRTSLKKKSIQVIETKNGDKNLEAVMWEKGYLLGAEQVGNLIINDGKHGSADSLYAISLLFTLLYSEKATLKKKTGLLKKKTRSLKKWPQVLATVHTTEIIPQEKIDRIKSEMESSSQLRPDFRIKYWYSSTEPGLFNVMMEGVKSEEGVESDELKTVSEQACLFCQKVLSLNKTQSGQIDIFDLSSRKRAN